MHMIMFEDKKIPKTRKNAITRHNMSPPIHLSMVSMSNILVNEIYFDTALLNWLNADPKLPNSSSPTNFQRHEKEGNKEICNG